MKEEELDWQVYHLLTEKSDRDENSLATLLHSSPEEIRESLKRLENALLVELLPAGIRVLSVQEMLLRCQARYDERCPFSFEGGVIRAKFGQGRKDD